LQPPSVTNARRCHLPPNFRRNDEGGGGDDKSTLPAPRTHHRRQARTHAQQARVASTYSAHSIGSTVCFPSCSSPLNSWSAWRMPSVPNEDKYLQHPPVIIIIDHHDNHVIITILTILMIIMILMIIRIIMIIVITIRYS
jgi:hypothetical protein